MTKIFISYRRADSQYVTDIVYDKMAGHFGKANVFLDVGSIPFGVDFRQYLNEQVAAHDVVLVVIGQDWARIMQERAGQQNDFVRIEIESALSQGKLVIPVLVKNASMPSFADLPDSIAELQWRNSARIRRQPDLDSDCRRLAEGIEQYFGSQVVMPSKRTSKELMPAPFDWIEIPAGKGMMKTNEDDVTLMIPTESYWISKYPITNAQFAKFMDAGGYSTERWWTEEGRQKRLEGWHYDGVWKPSGTPWKEPRHWTDNRFIGDDKPVVGVSWYECVAFCMWLKEETGENIMLPTEAQWQYAVQGDDGRAYPWGNEWDSTKCQHSVGNNAGKTSPVIQYEGKHKGNSPFGVVDMAGNVLEWCLTDYENRTNDVNSIANRRVLRGGSWMNNNTYYFRCDYRIRLNRLFGNNGRGFRVARLK